MKTAADIIFAIDHHIPILCATTLQPIAIEGLKCESSNKWMIVERIGPKLPHRVLDSVIIKSVYFEILAALPKPEQIRMKILLHPYKDKLQSIPCVDWSPLYPSSQSTELSQEEVDKLLGSDERTGSLMNDYDGLLPSQLPMKDNREY